MNHSFIIDNKIYFGHPKVGVTVHTGRDGKRSTHWDFYNESEKHKVKGTDLVPSLWLRREHLKTLLISSITNIFKSLVGPCIIQTTIFIKVVILTKTVLPKKISLRIFMIFICKQDTLPVDSFVFVYSIFVFFTPLSFFRLSLSVFLFMIFCMYVKVPLSCLVFQEG